MPETVGRVAAINRYPVKSMQGEQPDEAEFDELGMLADRTWAVIDVASGRALSAKREARLLDAAARWEAGAARPTVTLPDGTVLSPGLAAEEVDAALTAWLGHEVRLAEAFSFPEPVSYEMSFNVDDEEADRFEVPMRTGRFLDLAPIHLLTTASIVAAAAGHAGGVWDVNRFRPTVLIELDGDRSGFVENDWVEQPVRLGSVVARPIMPTIRCPMTTRAQAAHGLERDLDILKTINRVNGGNLGTYGEIDQPGTVRVGDAVVIGS